MALEKHDISLEKHDMVMKKFFEMLKNKKGVIMKGGTALRFFYDLDRFSVDFDFDAENSVNLETEVGIFCEKNGYSFVISKDIKTVWRSKIDYGEGRPLKIELSYRSYIDSESEEMDGYRFYNINELANQKINAFSGRDKCRDIYDIYFILKKYKDRLSGSTLARIKDVVYYAGMDSVLYQFEQDQKEDRILKDVDGVTLVLELFEMLDLLE